jgi:hypothetical protein
MVTELGGASAALLALVCNKTALHRTLLGLNTRQGRKRARFSSGFGLLKNPRPWHHRDFEFSFCARWLPFGERLFRTLHPAAYIDEKIIEKTVNSFIDRVILPTQIN